MILVLRRRVLSLLALTVTLLLSVGLVRLFYPLAYVEQITAAARAHGMDPYLIAAVIRVESGFNPRSQSPKGARGLMQVMPETGAWVAEQMGIRDFSPDDLDDPRLNIWIGTWYLADLKRAFDGQLILALAAYNGGRGNVRRWIERHDLIAADQAVRLENIPFPETRAFVQRVLWSYRVYRLLYPRLDE